MSMRRFTRRLAFVAIVPMLCVVALARPASATSVVIIGAAMEGNLQLPPGSSVGAGYDLAIPAGATLYVRDATAWLSYACSPKGPAAGELALHFPDAALSGPGWQPSGVQDDPAVWQVASLPVAPATAVCGGRSVWVSDRTGGATFTGEITSRPAGTDISVRFHYRETTSPDTAGSWSQTELITASSTTETRPASGGPAPHTSPASGSPPAGAATDLGHFAPPGGGLSTLQLVLLTAGVLALLGGLGLMLPVHAGGRRRRRPAPVFTTVREGPPSSARTRPRSGCPGGRAR